MKVFEYTAADAQAGRCPFRGEYAEDYWLAYHGTSNHAEQLIETDGFTWCDRAYTAADVHRLLQVFNHLQWFGTGTTSAAVLLSGFTEADFREGTGGRKRVYFAESSYRALLYTSRFWAGGETATFLRAAFDDLRRYAASPDLRQDATWTAWCRLRDYCASGGFDVPAEWVPPSRQEVSLRYVGGLWRHYRNTRGVALPFLNGLPPVEPAELPESWLSERLQPLEVLAYRCRALHESFQYGLIYAVRFAPTDLEHPDLTLSHAAGGLSVLGPLGPERIVAKARIAPEVDYDRNARQFYARDNRSRLRACMHDGIVARVQREQRERDADPPAQRPR